MKVAITSTGTTKDAQMDLRFGRAQYFIIADTQTGEFEAVPNSQNLNAAQGAGIQSAQTVAKQGAEAVITGHVGPKAFRTLAAAGIKIYLVDNLTVEEAIERLKKGELTITSTADVESHWA